MKEISRYIVVGLLVLLAAHGVYSYFQEPERIYVPVPGPVVQFDSTGWVRESMYITTAQALDSLKKVNTKLYQEITQNKQEVTQTSNILGKLRLERDSLSQLVRTFEVADLDTTFNDVYGDSLFVVQSKIGIAGNSVSYRSNLVQMRPINITTVTTTKDDRMYFYVYSEDFEELNIETYTTLKKPRYKWYHYMGAGALGGLITWELIR